MQIDDEEESNRKSNALRTLRANGALGTSIAKLSGSSRVIPREKDFYFYDNFAEFKTPVKETGEKSKRLLKEIGALEELFGKVIEFPSDKDIELDDDVAYDWLEDVNDELSERFDASLDEFRMLRKKEEEGGRRIMRSDDDHEFGNGFQVVSGKKNKNSWGSESKGVQEVKVATKLKPKIPFHIPTIPKPQDEYKIIVNNTNQPFEHVWLQKSEDGSRFIHPLEKLHVGDFIDSSASVAEPAKPPPIETTPFTFVEDLKDLKQLASKLRAVNEFAVDLEHNQYRSFQGLTCLMQISTRTEDFVIDTLKLRIYIGPHLREVFKDPTKRKVLHGANSDIMWLQRDFGIYVCNMFDTGQASRVLNMERNSLEYLLKHFCEVIANKEYQNADWRLRPLPHEMVKYAREDTHYLLYIYDVMRMRLLMSPTVAGSDPPLVEVYKRSYDICTQLYEKELLTESSYLHIYGLLGADLSAQQLAVVSGLCEWRDIVARSEDESTGYVLPNRTLIDIAKQMPLTTSNLRRMLKSKLPYIERNLSSVVSIIRHSIQNAAAFEESAEYLKQKYLQMVSDKEKLATEEPEMLPCENAEELGKMLPKENKVELQDIGSSGARIVASAPEFPQMNSSLSVEVTVQALKKPNRAFGALLGGSAKRKFAPDKKEQEDSKLGLIKSTVSLPFHKFLGGNEPMSIDAVETEKAPKVPPSRDTPAPDTGSSFEDIIVLDDDSDIEEPAKPEPQAGSTDQLNQDEIDYSVGFFTDSEDEDEPMSLTDLSSSFEKLSSQNKTKNSGANKSEPSASPLHVKPFDYEAARKQIQFGKTRETKIQAENDGNGTSKKKNVAVQSENDDGTRDLLQGRRRQAFPASGNRSATFRN